MLREPGTGDEYVNNQTDSEAARVRAAYGENYERLAAIKRDWDPDNIFRSMISAASQTDGIC